MKHFFVALLTLCFAEAAEAEKLYQYRLYLSDKAESPFTLNQPHKYLSRRAIDRREREGVAIDSLDLPLSPHYVKQIKRVSKHIIAHSKWMNTVAVEFSDTAIVASLLALPCVRSAKRIGVRTVSDELPALNEGYERIRTIPKEEIPEGNEYGQGYDQIALHNGDKLHSEGFRGNGLWIGVIDAGFQHADRIEAIPPDRIIGARDMVNPRASVYENHYHGTRVLSTMAANERGKMVGSAPDARYLLLRSEIGETEFSVEEDYFAAALEYADSVGVDIVTSSLGYSKFDDGVESYTYANLNGYDAYITQAASIAAHRGIFMVISAGNEANGEWRYITFPADSPDVLTVGAIDKEGQRSSFSSLGPTADSRLKPDVVGLGTETVLLDTNGSVITSNGTSYSTPIIAGLVACLKQALPHVPNQQLLRLIKQHSNNPTPDNETGRGAPDFWAIYQAQQPSIDSQ